MNEREIFIAAIDISDAQQRAAYLDAACGDSDVPLARRGSPDPAETSDRRSPGKRGTMRPSVDRGAGSGDPRTAGESRLRLNRCAACGGDAALRQRVAALLHSHESAGSFLQGNAAGPSATADFPPLAERPGTLVGRYKLLQEIGEGGMDLRIVAPSREGVDRQGRQSKPGPTEACHVQLQPKKNFLSQPIAHKGLRRDDPRKTKNFFVLRVTNPHENQAIQIGVGKNPCAQANRRIPSG